MEVPVHELDVDDSVLEFGAHANHTHGVPTQDAMLASDEVIHTVRQKGHLGIKTVLLGLIGVAIGLFKLHSLFLGLEKAFADNDCGFLWLSSRGLTLDLLLSNSFSGFVCRHRILHIIHVNVID